MNEAKSVFQSIESIGQDVYLFPKRLEKSFDDPLYEYFQRFLRQVASELCQLHTILWNDGVDRQTKNRFVLNNDDLDRLFQCEFVEEKDEKQTIEKQIQSFAQFVMEVFVASLLEKEIQLKIDEDSTTVSIQLEQEIFDEQNRLEQFQDALNFIEELFNVLNSNLLSRQIK